MIDILHALGFCPDHGHGLMLITAAGGLVVALRHHARRVWARWRRKQD